jgi:hypothetical protein
MLPNNHGVAIGVYGGDDEIRTVGTQVPGGTVGISFTAKATINSGVFQWVQLINGDQTNYLNSVGKASCPPTPKSGLDTTYPYPFAPASTTTTFDSPNSSLPSNYGELQRSFTATMYLMWDPTIPTGCTPAQTSGNGVSTPSQCTSIPIPLSSVQWHYSGCGINSKANQQNGTTWLLQCGINNVSTVQASGPAVPDNGFPTWSTVVTGPVSGCVPTTN